MKATTKRTNEFKVRKKVPFEEMRRLMEVYGSTKCLRKRTDNMKTDSIKRKFYRWFPDLKERFDWDEYSGMYLPKLGHELEMQYREDMRKKNEMIISLKRIETRKKSFSTLVHEPEADINDAETLSVLANTSRSALARSVTPVSVPSKPSSFNQDGAIVGCSDTKPEFDDNDDTLLQLPLIITRKKDGEGLTKKRAGFHQQRQQARKHHRCSDVAATAA